jgi:RHS repeat-associated protein
MRERLVYGDESDPNQISQKRTAERSKNRLGKLAEHNDEAGRVLFTQYDYKGNLLEKTRGVISDMALATGWTANWGAPNADNNLDAMQYTISTQYDALNRPTQIQYPTDVNGQRALLEPTYNRAGALEQVALDRDIFVQRIAYNAKGQRTFITYGSGLLTRYAYDSRTFRLTRLRTESFTRTGLTYRPIGTLLQDWAYDYDLSGNILAIHDIVPGCGLPNNPDQLDRLFGYDGIYRLISATGRECNQPAPDPYWSDPVRCQVVTRTRRYTQTYTYDVAGNMTALTHTSPNNGSFTRTFDVKPGNNRLDKVTVGPAAIGKVYNYQYDDNGNMTDETTSRRFKWDHADRLQEFRETAGTNASILARYLYDSTGMRVKKWVRRGGTAANDESTVYVDGIFEHHRWRKSGGGQNNHLHVMDNQNPVAIVRKGSRHPDDTGPVVQYQLGDHLGSCAAVLDQNGALVNTEEFFPYGETSFGSSARKRYRYTGKERDGESRLYYFGARYYSPWLARWLSCDANTAFRDLFDFVAQNPVRFKDPDGRYEKDMHYGVVLYLFKSAGHKEREAKEIAEYNQFVDESPQTEPLQTPILSGRIPLSTGMNDTTNRNRAFFHFVGSTKTKAVTAAEQLAKQRLVDALTNWQGKSASATRSPANDLQNTFAKMEVGAAGHAYLDTWSHEDFTAYPVESINKRTGSLRPDVGHADAAEEGHAPDRPYNDVERALTAAESLYSLIPKTKDAVPWEDLEKELRVAFSNFEPAEGKRLGLILDLYEKRFGNRPQFDPKRVQAYRPMFDAHIHGTWRSKVEKREQASKSQ